MARGRQNPDYLNGIPELLILRFLSEEPMYGYQIVEAIEQQSQQTLSFGEGCIYPILHRLEKQKFILGKREKINGRSRITYRLTKKGEAKFAESASNWEAVINAVAGILKDESPSIPHLA